MSGPSREAGDTGGAAGLDDALVARLRAETRGCEAIVHLNNAGAALMPVPVADMLRGWLTDEEHRGGYETASARAAELERFYAAAGRLLNCAADEVAFVENATRAWDMAFYGLRLGAGDCILTSVSEYGSNVIAMLHRARHSGVVIEFMGEDASGQVDAAAVAERLADRSRPPVRLVALSHVPTGNGLVNPAAEVGRLAREAGVPYLLDACQSAGQMPLDVEALGCDMLSATGRKYLRGPRGTGLLYVRRGFLDRLDPPFLDQHAADLISPDEYRMRGDARRFESWERFCAGQAGLAAAMDYACDIGLARIYARIRLLASTLRRRLTGLPGVEVCDGGVEQCGIVTFRVAGLAPEAVKAHLADLGINVSVSSGSGNLVWFQRHGYDALVRASVHCYNTAAELDRLAEALEALRA
jgi:selenocysteine lyase/cysteine desulfurase